MIRKTIKGALLTSLKMYLSRICFIGIDVKVFQIMRIRKKLRIFVVRFLKFGADLDLTAIAFVK